MPFLWMNDRETVHTEALAPVFEDEAKALRRLVTAQQEEIRQLKSRLRKESRDARTSMGSIKLSA